MRNVAENTMKEPEEDAIKTCVPGAKGLFAIGRYPGIYLNSLPGCSLLPNLLLFHYYAWGINSYVYSCQPDCHGKKLPKHKLLAEDGISCENGLDIAELGDVFDCGGTLFPGFPAYRPCDRTVYGHSSCHILGALRESQRESLSKKQTLLL